MSGAAGHLSHLHENRQLTFGEIKDIIQRAADGKLDNVTEKLDGMNLVFTWNVSLNELRVARNTTDVKNGGIDIATLAKRFYGRQNVEQAFTTAFRVLNEALSFFNDRMKIMSFGNRGQLWYSMEVIIKDDPNVINYDANAIVFHEYPVYEVVGNTIMLVDNAPGIELLTKNIDNMQASISRDDWLIRGPANVSLKKMSGDAAKEAILELSLIQRTVDANDGETLEHYIERVMHSHVHARWFSASKEVEGMIVRRVAGIVGSPTTLDIKKLIPKSEHDRLATFIKESPDLQKEAMRPIESAIQSFAVKVLKNVQSMLIRDHKKEIERIRVDVTKAINAIRSSGNEAAIEVLKREMSRLEKVENVSSTVEGIVFTYKGQMYKITGSFAPAHQILSLFKYGRKGIPKLTFK